MRICLITEWFSPNMGYVENCLPKALVHLGHDVHVISSTYNVYATSKSYKSIYEPFLGPPNAAAGDFQIDGFTLHRLPSLRSRGTFKLKGLYHLLHDLAPDVIQVFDLVANSSLISAFFCYKKKIPLFTTHHATESSFPLAHKSFINHFKRIKWFYRKTIYGRFVSIVSRKSYPPTIDCEKIAVRFMGLQKKKSKICPLGVDTFTFSPLEDAEIPLIESQRDELGIKKKDIVCIYTGRFTKAKDPLCLANALDELNRQGFNEYKGLFLGDGPQREQIKSSTNCIVIPFVPVTELPKYYRCCDIAVWPRQESTSMLDAAACGLPVVVSNKVQAMERYEGNGFTYKEGDYHSLADILLKLKSTKERKKLGKAGSEKMINKHSWLKIAEERIKDYLEVLNK